MVCGNIFLILPIYLLRIVLSSVIGTNQYSEYLMLSFLSVIFVSQLVRNMVRKHITPHGRRKKMVVIFKELLPRFVGFFFYYCTFIALLTSSSSFMGYSDPTSIRLGDWVYSAQSQMYSSFRACFWPGFGIFLVCLSFMLLSHGFSTSLNSQVLGNTDTEFQDNLSTSYQVS